MKSDAGRVVRDDRQPDDVIKLAGRGGEFDLAAEFGVDADRVAAYGAYHAAGDRRRASTRCATPASRSSCATRRPTSARSFPSAGGCPTSCATTPGVIFASAFPGIEEFATDVDAFAIDQARREERAELEAIRARLSKPTARDVALDEIDRRLHDLGKLDRATSPTSFDRRFLFRVLSMGHSQFADLIGARGPNTQVNSACASTTQAVAIAQDWIRAGRCRRVVVVAGRRRHLRRPPRLVRLRLPGDRRSRHRRRRRARRRSRSTAAATG